MRIKSSGPIYPDRERAMILYEARRPLYEETLQSLYRRVRRLLENSGFTPSIKYRVKRFEAYYEKLRRPAVQGKTKTAAAISDMLGLRIICPFLEDIETIRELIATNFEVTEVDRKASRHSFREFGYDSMHLLVKLDKNVLKRALPGTRRVCEVQLRTILQDAWAEVEHELVYKSDISIPNESIRRKLASLNATLTLSDLIFQEIRDYQKAIRQRGRRRQEKISETLDLLDILTISQRAEDASKEPFIEAMDSSPSSSQLERTMLQALDAHSNHDLETAINLYGKLLRMHLTRDIRSLVYNHRGMAYFAGEEIAKATSDFSNAIRFNPENSRGYFNRGLCHRITRKYDKALSDFDTALSIDPLSPETYYNRAQTYHEMELYCKALHDCEKTLELSPGHQAADELARALKERLA